MKNKKHLQITAIIFLTFVIMCELGFISGRFFAGLPVTEKFAVEDAVGEIFVSGKIIKINNESVPSYSVEGRDGVYFTDYDLGLMGIKCSLSDGIYSLEVEKGHNRIANEDFIGNILGTKAFADKNKIKCGLKLINIYKNDRVLLIPSDVLDTMCKKVETEDTTSVYYAFGPEAEKIIKEAKNEIELLKGKEEEAATGQPVNEVAIQTTAPLNSGEKIIVIDPGHGKSSSLMSADEKKASGWVQNSGGAWGEWSHYKIGSSTVDCNASGCNGRVTPNGACWYPMGNGDRATEPELNLANALAAEKYLKEMGYTVRMTRRTGEENPSITRRLSYCYPNNDTSLVADASAFICIHSNAGGGRGTAYISASGAYDQKGITDTYVADSNRLGELCNNAIVNSTSIGKCGTGVIGFEPELIAFCKSPVPCGYLEIGFFDNATELANLRNESDKIGKAIAEGVDTFMKERY